MLDFTRARDDAGGSGSCCIWCAGKEWPV